MDRRRFIPQDSQLGYSEIILKLFDMFSVGGQKKGLENPLLFDQALNFPSQAFPSIHIAGSNGKGSVATKIAKSLEFSGIRVGLFTSPHVFTYRERISVSGELITEKEVTEGIRHLFSIAKSLGMSPTFFEYTMMLAFEHFRKKKVDIAVIEAGIGGRLDTTNILKATLAVITSIYRDHCKILGNTLDKIASEKAGIIKPNIPVVLGWSAQRKCVLDKAKKENSPLILCPKIEGDFERENEEIASKALLELKKIYPLTNSAIEKGLKVTPLCRFEVVDEFAYKKVIFDVAHNPDGFRNLFKRFNRYYGGEKFHLIFGMGLGKELKAIVQVVAKNASHISLVSRPGRYLYTCEQLRDSFKAIDYHNVSYQNETAKTIHDAVSKAKKKNAWLIVCGSFYIMSDVKKALSLTLI